MRYFGEVRSVSAHTPGSLVFAEIGAGLSVFEGGIEIVR